MFFFFGFLEENVAGSSTSQNQQERAQNLQGDDWGTRVGKDVAASNQNDVNRVTRLQSVLAMEGKTINRKLLIDLRNKTSIYFLIANGIVRK